MAEFQLLDRRAAAAAMATSAALLAHQVGARAIRDALFLSEFPVTTLSGLIAASALISAAVALPWSRLLWRQGPDRLVQRAFLISALFLLAIWGLSFYAARPAAIATYLHTVVFGPIIASGFWSLVGERFDVRTAKRTIGRLAGIGTIGGIAGGLIAAEVSEWAGATAMLPVLAALHLGCIALVRGVSHGVAPAARPASAGPGDFLGGVRAISTQPYLRNLAAVVAVGAMGAVFLEYVFKAEAAAAVRDQRELVMLFAFFHSGVAALTFLLQVLASGPALKHLGLARTVAIQPLSVAVGGALAALVPGLASALTARGAENVLRGSLFRSGYQLLFTPIPVNERRSTKSLIDIALDRIGEATGGGLTALLVVLAGPAAPSVMLWAAAGIGVVGIGLALRLHRGYVAALESSLLRGAVRPDAVADQEATTREMMETHKYRIPLVPDRDVAMPEASMDMALAPGDELLTVAIDRATLMAAVQPKARGGAAGAGSASAERVARAAGAAGASGVAGAAGATGGSGASGVAGAAGATGGSGASGVAGAAGAAPAAAFERAQALVSGDRARILAALVDPLPQELVSLVIPLVAQREVAPEALRALHGIALSVIGQLTDALLNPDLALDARRRIARLLGMVGGPRAIEGLLSGIGDPRFAVRLASGLALARLRERFAETRFDVDRVFTQVHREVDVERQVWLSQRQIEQLDDASPIADAYVHQRASASLEHVFNLLALVLPQQPLQVAFRRLHEDDRNTRGMALEYLETVLPAPIREKMWPFLEADANQPVTQRSRNEILADLQREYPSMRIPISELRKADSQ